jgi:hypothetical protein
MPEPQHLHRPHLCLVGHRQLVLHAPYKFLAPADAVEVQRIAIGTEIVLEEQVGAGGRRSIYDAEYVG